MTETQETTGQRCLREAAEIRDIYTLLYPERQLNFRYHEGHSPDFGAPCISEDDPVFTPDDLSADYLGCESLAPPFPGARPVTVRIAVPRAPTPGEMAATEPDWMPRATVVRQIFRVSPLRYEWMRYKIEMRRLARAGRHHWDMLACGQGSDLFQKPVRPQTAERPAILIGMHWLEVGGAEKMGFDTVHWALEAGLRVFVVAELPGVQRAASRLPDHPDVKFIRLDRYLNHEDWPRYLANLVLRENIRMIHIHHCVPLYASLAHLRARVPDLIIADTTHIVEYSDGGYPRISGVWSHYIDMHHVISRELMDFYRDRFHEISKVRLGRMLERQEQAPPLPAASLNPEKKKLHIAFVGRMVYQKRPVVAVEALRALARWCKAREITLRVTWVGEGPLLEVVKQLVNRYGLASVVTFHEAGCDVGAVFDDCDILLLPSSNEGLALVCYEAVEHGCIPVTTGVGSQSEIVPGALLLPLSPPEAVKSFVDHVEKLWSDPEFRAAQVREMQEKYRTLAADPTARELLLPVYKSVAAGHVPEF